MTLAATGASVDLYWLPLGAGGKFVRLNGRLYEAVAARREHRPAHDLYHSALEVRVDGARYVIEMAPVWNDKAPDRGAVCEGAVGARMLGRWRWFRYEVRCWRDGRIPDVGEAVASPQTLSRSTDVARQLLASVATVPPLVWGRDELHLGEMWNSNSLIAWLLAGQAVVDRVVFPPNGRAPGWYAGLRLAAEGRQLTRAGLPPDMKALALVDRDAAPAVIDVPDRDAGPGEVRIAVEAASVNGFDLAVASGRVWDSMHAEFPVVLGRDFAGTIAAVGPDVDTFAIGDRVAGTIHGALGAGGIGEYVGQSATTLAPVPAGVSSLDAAAVGLAGGAAIDVLDALDPNDNDVVFISGATGGVGLYLTQLVAARGARVIATATPGAAEDVVRRLGAAAVVDHTGDVGAQLREIAPDGVDKVAHLAGDATALAQLVRPGGDFASLLGASNDSLGRDDITVTAIQARVSAEKLSRLLDEVAAKRLDVLVAQTYPLDRATEALDAFRTAPFGKIVITI